MARTRLHYCFREQRKLKFGRKSCCIVRTLHFRTDYQIVAVIGGNRCPKGDVSGIQKGSELKFKEAVRA